MSTPGPIARSARDLLLALNVLAGPDADVASALAAIPLSARHTRIADFRVLVLDQHPLLPTDTEAASAVVEFARRLATKGAKVVDGSKKVPSLTLSTMNYMRLLGATLSTGQNTEARANFVALDAELSGDRTMRGNFVRGSMFSHSEWIEAQETRIALRWQWNQLFEEYDAVICPVVPVTHLTHAQLDRGEVAVNGQTVTIDDLIVWAALSKSADLPATVVPFTESRDGYPIGVQIIAPFMEDATSIGLAILAGQQDISPAYAKIIHPPYLERGAHTRA
jgi:amidase